MNTQAGNEWQNPKRRSTWKVAVFPSGTEVGLEIYRALSYCKEVELIGLSSPAKSPGPFVYQRHREISDVHSIDFTENLAATLTDIGADFLFPAHALVIDALLDIRELLPCPIAMSRTDVVRLTRSKSHTYSALSGIIPLPRAKQFPPVFVKPDSLYGEQGARIITNVSDLADAIAEDPTQLIQEVLPGQEWTVDCLSNSNGDLLFASARTRERIRMGTSLWSEIAPDDIQVLMRRYAQLISNTLAIDGPWFFQMKEDLDGTPRLLEVEARIAGTMCLHRAQGINFPLLALYLWSGQEVSLLLNDGPSIVARSLRNHYSSLPTYSNVYVDLDDTIVVHGVLNLRLVSFLFQCRELGKKVVLLSKSLHVDPDGYLESLALGDLFSECIWISENESKADYIEPLESILIDDSFQQRKEVANRHKIPTFSPDMIDALIVEGS